MSLISITAFQLPVLRWSWEALRRALSHAAQNLASVVSNRFYFLRSSFILHPSSFILLLSWMRFLIRFQKLFHVQMSVFLRRGQARVTEELLNQTQIGAGLKKMSGKRVTKSMRRYFLLKRKRFHIRIQNLPHAGFR